MTTRASTHELIQVGSDSDCTGLLDEAPTLQITGSWKKVIKLASVVSLVLAVGIVGTYSVQHYKVAQKNSFNAESVVMLDGKSDEKAEDASSDPEESAPPPSTTSLAPPPSTTSPAPSLECPAASIPVVMLGGVTPCALETEGRLLHGDNNDDDQTSDNSDDNEDDHKSDNSDDNEDDDKSDNSDDNEDDDKSDNSDDNDDDDKSDNSDDNEDDDKSDNSDENDDDDSSDDNAAALHYKLGSAETFCNVPCARCASKNGTMWCKDCKKPIGAVGAKVPEASRPYLKNVQCSTQVYPQKFNECASKFFWCSCED